MASGQSVLNFPSRKRVTRVISIAQGSESVQSCSPEKKAKLIQDENSQVLTSSPSKGAVKRALFSKPGSSTPSKTEVRGNLSQAIALSSPVKIAVSSPSSRLASLQLSVPNVSPYQEAKQALHTSVPDTLLCRESQLEVLNTFLRKHLTTSQPGSLYISGAPGTGKTACLLHLLQQKADDLGSFKTVFINCMSLRTPSQIYTRIAQELDSKFSHKSERETVRFLEQIVTRQNKPVVLILDELDQLNTSCQSVVYSIFELPALANSRLILIGIANALDLTDRILLRLQTRLAAKPQLLNFPPYTKAQIAQILSARLAKLSDSGLLIKPNAIQFLSGKVAAVSGDLRKALDVCRRAIELNENEAKKQLILHTVPDHGNSPLKANAVKPVTVKAVDLAQILALWNRTYGNVVTTKLDSDENGLPLQQKILICTLLLLSKASKTKEVTMGKLHDTYAKICRKHNLSSIDHSEFQNLCSLVESRGVLSIKVQKEARLAKVSMRYDEREVEATLQDKTLMSSILSQTDLLAKVKKL